MAKKSADVVIVGMGGAGAILARELTEAGFKVLGIDKGAYHPAEEFWLKFDELRYSVRGELSPTMDNDPMTWRPDERTKARVLPWAVGPLPINPLLLPPSLGVGGGTTYWAGLFFRQLREDFRMRSTLIERYGERKLPEGSHIVDWPISYEDLEPYYDRIEHEIGVSGQAGNIRGTIQKGGNPFEAPRSRPYPLPPLETSGASELFANAARELGYHPFPTPAAILSQDQGARKACTYCGFCRDYGCHVGAKANTIDTMIPSALSTGNLDLLTNCRVQKINVDREGLARSVSYVDAKGQQHEASGDLIILCAYSLENARLMLVSGLNKNGMVGKHFTLHNYSFFSGTLPERTHIYAGPAVAGYTIDDFNADLIDHSDLNFIWGSPIFFFEGDFQPIETAGNLPPDVPRWGKGFKNWLKEEYGHLFAMFSQISTLPMQSNYVDLDPEVKDPWGQPALRITHNWNDNDRETAIWLNRIKQEIANKMGATRTWTAPELPPYHVTTHEMGTHSMGEDPRTSVVDPYCRSHEVPNLFLVGGGVFPTYNGYNPTETIQAITYRTADYIKRESRQGKVVSLQRKDGMQ